MSNSQMQEFSGRLRRIEKIHRKGGGFEAAGTLGQSYYTKLRLRNQRRPLMRPLVILVAVVETFKGAMLASIGQEAYAAKLATLAEGSAVEKAGGFIMTIDPIAMTIAQAIGSVLN